MSQENVELARRAILGWNERGVEAFVEACDPEVEYHAPKESMNPGVYHGHAGVRDYYASIGEVLREQRVESVHVTDVGDDRVVAVVHAFAKTAHFDGEVEMNWAFLITATDGMATRVETFTDRAQALEAAGLSE